MALTCARCGAQNPDGNSFCQACGTPLTAAAAGTARPASPGPPPGPPPGLPPGSQPGAIAGPPPGLAPPVPTMGGGYQSPYYVPTVPHAPVHRTRWPMIIAGVVGLVIVMAGCGTVLAVIGSRGAITVSGGITSGLPSPTPAGSPSPLVTPTAASTGPTTASTLNLVVPVPAGWTVSKKADQYVVLVDPSGNGFVEVESMREPIAVTAQQLKDATDQQYKNQYPDAKACPNSPTTSVTLNNFKGLFWTLCFTYTQGSRAAPAAAAFTASVNSDGSAYYAVTEITFPPSNLQNVINEAKPIVQGVQWKLT